jgi:hypothetical protein
MNHFRVGKRERGLLRHHLSNRPRFKRPKRHDRSAGRTNLALRRFPLTPTLLSTHVAALAAQDRCDGARALSSGADTLFSTSCRWLGASGQPMGCAEYVRSTSDSLVASCSGDERAQASPAQPRGHAETAGARQR